MENEKTPEGAALDKYVKELEDIQLALQKLCHADTCTLVTMCPEEHPLCKEKLDTRTAIAWTTSALIDTLLYWSRHSNPSNDSKKHFERRYDQLAVLGSIVHFHRETDLLTQVIYNLIGRARMLIKYIVSRPGAGIPYIPRPGVIGILTDIGEPE